MEAAPHSYTIVKKKQWFVINAKTLTAIWSKQTKNNKTKQK